MHGVLSNIYAILFAMSEQCMFGMDYAFSSWRNDKLPHSDEFKDKINSLFANTISDCYKIAEKIIEKNKELIKKLISGKEMTVKTVRKLFKTARKSANSIILFDDIDYLDKDEDIDIYGQILKEISHCTNNTVFIIATADHNKYLPEFFFDEFNSDMIIELNPPKIEEACKIFKPIFDEERVEENFDIKDFCCFAQDWTYSDLENALNHAARLAVYERCEKITMKHLIRAGLLLKDNVLTEEFDETTAYHEAGHAAVSLLLGGDAACIVLLEEGIGYFKEKNWNLETYKDREFNFSCDLMEPFRPIVDEAALSLEEGDEQFKRKMANVLNFGVVVDGIHTTLDLAIRRNVRSVLSVLESGDISQFSFPREIVAEYEL